MTLGGSIDISLAELVGELQDACVGAGLTVATAESCTGGRVAAAITGRAGASTYFVGGIISYSDKVKIEQLGVDRDLLAGHGAVSAQVALAMASGVRARLGSDLGVGITGVAGPDGGTDAKPVGLVYVGIADTVGTDVRRFVWTGDRATNIEESAGAAVALLLEHARSLGLAAGSRARE